MSPFDEACNELVELLRVTPGNCYVAGDDACSELAELLKVTPLGINN